METLANDLLEGIAEIGEFYGFGPRRTYYLAGRGLIPVFKIGNRWCALRSASRAHIEQLQAEGNMSE